MNLFLKSFCALAVVILLAGCDQDGMNLGGGSSPAGPAGSQEVGLLSLLSSDDDSGSGQDNPSLPDNDGSEDGNGEQIAQVHNPEPASMILWGIGLAGAAFSRRRKKA